MLQIKIFNAEKCKIMHKNRFALKSHMSESSSRGLIDMSEIAVVHTLYSDIERTHVISSKSSEGMVLNLGAGLHLTENTQKWISVGILCFINLINYIDRYTISGMYGDD